jgi:glycosyltransferase involved in cell wall biosynthesis
MLEAMSMAKPVIATAFSANLDYMHGENGLLVPCRLVEIEADVGPYERGQVWADPDLEHAATCMRRVRDDAALVRRLGERAREDIARDWSAAAVGARIRRRLEAIA